MSQSNRFIKDPDATIDFSVDWTDWLGTDTIVTSTWTVPTGLTSVTETNTTKIATIFLSGGTTGSSYEIINRITTAEGRTDDRTLLIVVQNK